MQKGTEVEFKSLLTKEEYTRLIEQFKGSKMDYQINHYFDTPRFSLKAWDTSLRVRQRNNYELTYKRKKGYNVQEITTEITEEEFQDIIKTGNVGDEKINNELVSIIGEQKLENYLSLATLRMFLSYGNGILFIDKSDYCGVTDYEIEYQAKTYHQGKAEFIELVSNLNISYKKAEKKIRRAYNAFKRLH